MVTPAVKKLEYFVDLKRVIRRNLILGIADGHLKADGNIVYMAKSLRVGLIGSSASEEFAATV